MKRRKEETAKTIAQLHRDLAKEEQEAKMNRRVSSSQNLRRATSLAGAPAVDDDGFVQISRASMKKVSSKGNISDGTGISQSPMLPVKPTKNLLRRSQSQPASMSSGSSSPSPFTKRSSMTKSIAGAPPLPPIGTGVVTSAVAATDLPSLEDCAKKTKNILKEYFVGGDVDEAVLSIHEMVEVGKDGSVERGAKVVEAGTLLVMDHPRLR